MGVAAARVVSVIALALFLLSVGAFLFTNVRIVQFVKANAEAIDDAAMGQLRVGVAIWWASFGAGLVAGVSLLVLVRDRLH